MQAGATCATVAGGHGEDMDAQNLLERSAFEASAIKALKQAFDEVWSPDGSQRRSGRRRKRQAPPGADNRRPRGLLGTENLEALKAAARAGFAK